MSRAFSKKIIVFFLLLSIKGFISETNCQFQMPLVSILAFFLYCHLPLLNSADEEIRNNSHKKPICPPSFDCKHLGDLRFPFYNSTDSHCGLMKLNCNEKVQTLQLSEGGQFYDVLRLVNQDAILVYDEGLQRLLHKRECDSLRNLSFPNSPSISFTVLDNITLFRCLKTSVTQNLFRDYHNYSKCNNEYNFYYRYPVDDHLPNPQNLPDNCSVIQLPRVNLDRRRKDASSDLFDLLSAEFILRFHISGDCQKCHNREGHCQNVDNEFHCAKAKGKGSKKRLILETAIPGAGLIFFLVIISIMWRCKKWSNLIPMIVGTATACVVILIVLLCCFWGKCSSCKTMIFGKYGRKDRENVEAFLRKYGPLAPKRYRYQDVKKMTNSFKCKLGQGGYGGVYKGKLHDGRDVAVKILNKLNGDGEEFVNEVASISRTSHINIVTLLGFCFEGSKRALIYEFMPNGSLEKFLPNEKSTALSQLGWETLYQIALGIARGLEYLHRGCNTRILHFDIKPHNILLDEEFCPKISDFGLAKLCFGKDSMISMLGIRGTPGYIAPEIFSRNFGGVSHKSDVYSYGMMILEIVGGKKNIPIGVDRSTEEYFPEWIYSRLELNAEIGLDGIWTEVENESTRKMLIVGLWCIQTNPSNRPSMNRVLEMLEGGLESLQVPPRPFFVHVTEPVAYSSTTS